MSGKLERILISLFIWVWVTLAMCGTQDTLHWWTFIFSTTIALLCHHLLKKNWRRIPERKQPLNNSLNQSDCVSNASPFHSSFDDMNPSCPASSRHSSWEAMHD